MIQNFTIKDLLIYFAINDEQKKITDNTLNQNINQLKLDSRKIMPCDLFIAIKGHHVDGHEFIKSAIKNGAIAILSEANTQQDDKKLTIIQHNQQQIIQISLYQLADKMADFANYFYNAPSDSLPVIAITGTNGKTTITQLICMLGHLLGFKTASLGTLGNGIYGALASSANTTSTAVEILTHLANFKAQKVDLVAMEVSSHGLALGRVKPLNFKMSLFTNLSRDHLDFHQTITNYERAKWSLFADNNHERAVKSAGLKIINYDDKTAQNWLPKLHDAFVVSAEINQLSAIKNYKHYLGLTHCSFHQRGVTLTIDSSFGSGTLTSQLLGAFNVSNLLMAISALLNFGAPFDEVINNASKLTPVIGRMEFFATANKPPMIVDYAHTPDALDKALQALKTHCNGKIWLIFGCGGDRDNGKRALMAKVALKHTKNIIITNDNPRTENEDKIIADILSGLIDVHVATIIKDRYKAISYAFDNANKEDMILIAGKGHEDYQIFGHEKCYYSDRESAQKIAGIKQ